MRIRRNGKPNTATSDITSAPMPGAHITQQQVKRFAPAMAVIHRKCGGVRFDEALVEHSKSPKHPLHGWIFDRGERAAAHEYYLTRARELIRFVGVVVTPRDGEPVTIREYYPMPKRSAAEADEVEATRTASWEQVKSDEELRRRVIEIARERVGSAQSSLSGLLRALGANDARHVSKAVDRLGAAKRSLDRVLKVPSIAA